MSKRIMKNFPIEFEGNTYWRSRSVAVVGYVFCRDKEGLVHVLANKRGPGCPNEVGKWCVVCGFLDFNEDGQHAVAREIYEETGVIVDPEAMRFDTVEFSTTGEQNVNLRYFIFLSGTVDDYSLSNEHNEKDETTDIQWVSMTDISKYDWAFWHDRTIEKVWIKCSMENTKNNKLW